MAFKPICPNHNCPLDGLGFPIQAKGTGICPVSGASFDYEAEVDLESTAVDKFGNKAKSKNWKVTGDD